jgi:hypothetical protein
MLRGIANASAGQIIQGPRSLKKTATPPDIS